MSSSLAKASSNRLVHRHRNTDHLITISVGPMRKKSVVVTFSSSCAAGVAWYVFRLVASHSGDG
jgi:hypothetical protein